MVKIYFEGKYIILILGTGIVGEVFKSEGYSNVDGSDMSMVSLELAKQKVNPGLKIKNNI